MKTQQGVSLVELMIGIGIALILLTGVLTVMLRVSTSGADSVQATRLNQQMRGSMDFVTKELQRAGYVDWYDYWASITTGSGTGVSGSVTDFYEDVIPQLSRFGKVELYSGTSTDLCETNCDCVLYSYDLNKDGFQGVGPSGTPGAGQNTDGFELFGMRYNENEDSIEIRTSGTHDCTSNTWSNITDDNVAITRFSLSMSYATSTSGDSTMYQLSGGNNWAWTSGDYLESCSPSLGTDTGGYDAGDSLCLQRRSIFVEIEGHVEDDPGVTVELENRVKLKNDRLHSAQ